MLDLTTERDAYINPRLGQTPESVVQSYSQPIRITPTKCLFIKATQKSNTNAIKDALEALH